MAGTPSNNANSMHSVIQHSLDVGHRIAHIQSRSQQANHIVFGQTRLLRCLLQSLYRNEDGYPVFIFHDFSPPFAVRMNLVRMNLERGSTENTGSSPEDLVSHRTAPSLP